jgi:hypothetical protein
LALIGRQIPPLSAVITPAPVLDFDSIAIKHRYRNFSEKQRFTLTEML